MITIKEATELFEMPFLDLLHMAHSIHIENFQKNQIQASSLLSVKTGGCSEDCSYCAQSKKAKMPLQSIETIENIVSKAKDAKRMGATRFCMGASGRSPTDEFVNMMCEAVREVKKLGLETCITMGMLTEPQVKKLKESGLDYYNHNIDTSESNYCNIITTHNFQDRIETIKLIQKYNINLCCGGIIGLGETNEDRISMLVVLANMNPQPKSIPINKLIKIPGTDLANSPDVDVFDFVRTVALARILMKKSYVRLAAGRSAMSEILQAMCFYAGANSIFLGEKLLTTINSSVSRDEQMFSKLGLKLMQ